MHVTCVRSKQGEWQACQELTSGVLDNLNASYHNAGRGKGSEAVVIRRSARGGTAPAASVCSGVAGQQQAASEAA